MKDLKHLKKYLIFLNEQAEISKEVEKAREELAKNTAKTGKLANFFKKYFQKRVEMPADELSAKNRLPVISMKDPQTFNDWLVRMGLKKEEFPGFNGKIESLQIFKNYGEITGGFPLEYLSEDPKDPQVYTILKYEGGNGGYHEGVQGLPSQGIEGINLFISPGKFMMSEDESPNAPRTQGTDIGLPYLVCEFYGTPDPEEGKATWDIELGGTSFKLEREIKYQEFVNDLKTDNYILRKSDSPEGGQYWHVRLDSSKGMYQPYGPDGPWSYGTLVGVKPFTKEEVDKNIKGIGLSPEEKKRKDDYEKIFQELISGELTGSPGYLDPDKNFLHKQIILQYPALDLNFRENEDLNASGLRPEQVHTMLLILQLSSMLVPVSWLSTLLMYVDTYLYVKEKDWNNAGLYGVFMVLPYLQGLPKLGLKSLVGGRSGYEAFLKKVVDRGVSPKALKFFSNPEQEILFYVARNQSKIKKSIEAYNKSMQAMAASGTLTIGTRVFSSGGLFANYFKYYANSTLKIGVKGFPLAKIAFILYYVLKVWEKFYGKIRSTEDLISCDAWFEQAKGWTMEEAKKDRKAWKVIREIYGCENPKDDENLRKAWEDGWRPANFDSETGKLTLPTEDLQTEKFKKLIKLEKEQEENFNNNLKPDSFDIENNTKEITPLEDLDLSDELDEEPPPIEF